MTGQGQGIATKTSRAGYEREIHHNLESGRQASKHSPTSACAPLHTAADTAIAVTSLTKLLWLPLPLRRCEGSRASACHAHRVLRHVMPACFGMSCLIAVPAPAPATLQRIPQHVCPCRPHVTLSATPLAAPLAVERETSWLDAKPCRWPHGPAARQGCAKEGLGPALDDNVHQRMAHGHRVCTTNRRAPCTMMRPTLHDAADHLV